MPREIESKTILNKTRRRDPWFLDDYTLNPYSACAFNCLFCYIRGSKYGEHMQDALSVKVNAVDLLRRQLKTKAAKEQYGIIVLASATDPYLKVEEQYKLTRQLLEVILEFRFPVHVITRSALVTRDLDLLEKINTHAVLPADLQGKLKGGTIVSFSFSTLHNEVASIFEPGATPPEIRLKALEQVKASGLTTGVSLMPLLPFISDTTAELDLFFATFKKLRVDYVMPATLTLFGTGKADSKTLMLKAIEKHYPQLLEKYQRFFTTSDQMPAYYKKAFAEKMQSLHQAYDLKDRIA
jgi:DNA repair photolyase